jgi:hypothetical protein
LWLQRLATTENREVEVVDLVLVCVVVVFILLPGLVLVVGGVGLQDTGAAPVPVIEVVGMSFRVPLPVRESVPRRGLDGKRWVAPQRRGK